MSPSAHISQINQKVIKRYEAFLEEADIRKKYLESKFWIKNLKNSRSTTPVKKFHYEKIHEEKVTAEKFTRQFTSKKRQFELFERLYR